MSLKQIGTDITAKPLAELQELNEQKRTDLESSLLKEALAISNDKCNGLIDRQNMLIKELTTTVNDLKRNNEANVNKINNMMWLYKSEMHQAVTDERQFKTEISDSIKRAVTTSASEVKDYALKQVDETIADVKKELTETQKEITKQREEMKVQHGFRKFMFWATPILFLLQTALTVFLLLK